MGNPYVWAVGVHQNCQNNLSFQFQRWRDVKIVFVKFVFSMEYMKTWKNLLSTLSPSHPSVKLYMRIEIGLKLEKAFSVNVILHTLSHHITKMNKKPNSSSSKNTNESENTNTEKKKKTNQRNGNSLAMKIAKWLSSEQ